MRRVFIFIALILVFFTSNSIVAQDKKSDLDKTLFNIEKGISKGSVAAFSDYFYNRTFLSLLDGTSDYYSSNQAYNVLQNFFNIYKPLDFSFTNVLSQSSYPSASGRLRYTYRGMRTTAQIFISLKKIDNNWKISQITIN